MTDPRNVTLLVQLENSYIYGQIVLDSAPVPKDCVEAVRASRRKATSVLQRLMKCYAMMAILPFPRSQ